MKSISPHTVELIEPLSTPSGLLSRWLGRVEPPSPRVLDEIVSSGELEAALALLRLAVAGPTAYREPLLGALDRLVRAAPVGSLVWLEQRARTLSELRKEGWAWSHDVTPDRARSLPATPASAAGIASVHSLEPFGADASPLRSKHARSTSRISLLQGSETPIRSSAR
jgi:hypothetical protein